MGSHHSCTSGMEGIEMKEVNVWGKSFVSMCQLKILQQNARMLTFILKIIAYSFVYSLGRTGMPLVKAVVQDGNTYPRKTLA